MPYLHAIWMYWFFPILLWMVCLNIAPCVCPCAVFLIAWIGYDWKIGTDERELNFFYLDVSPRSVHFTHSVQFPSFYWTRKCVQTFDTLLWRGRFWKWREMKRDPIHSGTAFLLILTVSEQFFSRPCNFLEWYLFIFLLNSKRICYNESPFWP